CTSVFIRIGPPSKGCFGWDNHLFTAGFDVVYARTLCACRGAGSARRKPANDTRADREGRAGMQQHTVEFHVSGYNDCDGSSSFTLFVAKSLYRSSRGSTLSCQE